MPFEVISEHAIQILAYVLFFAQQERYANKQAEGEMIRSLQGLVKGLQDQLNERGNRLR